jgi:hypothetical protein
MPWGGGREKERMGKGKKGERSAMPYWLLSYTSLSAFKSNFYPFLAYYWQLLDSSESSFKRTFPRYTL